MLVTFRTSASGDITMFGDPAVKLLRLMGHSGTVPSAMNPEDIPEALEKLGKALAEMATEPVVTKDEELESTDNFSDEPVSLRNRALPLIELFEAAAAEDVPVLWDR